MKLKHLTEDETKIVKACMDCVAGGEVILHDFEFQTVMGVDVDEFLAIVEAWPNIDESDDNTRMAISNAINNLLGYPHGMQKRWHEVMPISLDEISRVFRKWKGRNVNSYFEGME